MRGRSPAFASSRSRSRRSATSSPRTTRPSAARRLDAHRARIEARTLPTPARPPPRDGRDRTEGAHRDRSRPAHRSSTRRPGGHWPPACSTTPGRCSRRTRGPPAQDDEMIHAAHASRYHWGEVSDDVHLARGEWQCARVYSVARSRRAGPLARPALRGAGRGGPGPRRLGPARRLRGDGPRAPCRRRRGRPRPSGRRRPPRRSPAIADAEDRTLIEGDLAGLP